MLNPWPAEDTFALLEEKVPGDLVPAPSLARMRPCLARLPGGSSSYFLECRLSAEDDRIDLGACFRSPLDAAAVPSSRPPWHRRNGQAGMRDPAGRTVREAFSLWQSRQAGLRQRVPFLWMEMDEPGARPDPGPPGFLFCVDPFLARLPSRFPAEPDSRAGLMKVADAVTDLFFGSKFPGKGLGALWDCIQALPPAGRILHISAMPSRRPAALKLNVLLPKKSLLGYLRRIRWPGYPPDLEPLWSGLHPHMGAAKIDLEISDGVSPRLGLELHPYNSSRAGRRAALAQMERTGLAQARKTAALGAWSGGISRVFPGHKWPTWLVKEFGMKVVLGASRSVQAKGYLGFYPIFTLR